MKHQLAHYEQVWVVFLPKFAHVRNNFPHEFDSMLCNLIVLEEYLVAF